MFTMRGSSWASVAATLLLVACDQGSASCGTGEQLVDGKCVAPATLFANSVGYVPVRQKIATSPIAATTFDVRDASSNEAVFTGSASAPIATEEGGSVTLLDFSALDAPGRYYVTTPGGGRSADFDVGPDAYRAALETVMLGLYGQRCGADVRLSHDGAVFTHGSCHLDDGFLDYVGSPGNKRVATGGWHDAGDYGKYTVNGAFAAGLMLMAWDHFGSALSNLELDIPERGGAVPDFLDEIKFELDYLLAMQLDDGSVSHKLTALDFEGLDVTPQADTSRRFFAPVGTAATASFAAVMARAARAYAPFDSGFAGVCQDAAERAWAFLVAHPTNIQPDLSEFKTGSYQTDDGDDRIWAAAELFETTGDPNALAEFESRATSGAVKLEWDWSDVTNLGVFTYVSSTRPERSSELVQRIATNLKATADALLANAESHAYGRSVGSKYYWGINGIVVRTTMTLVLAHRLEQKTEWLDAAVRQLDYVFGNNPYGRSFVTGVGHLPPERPHHRPSVSDGVVAPWPGLLVGGPWPTSMSWTDEVDDYKTNEVAINWSAALAYALAAFLPESDGSTP